MAALLSIKNINKTYQNKFKALSNINLDIMHGEFIALLGPSGCGKTTLLTTLAGFLAPDSGQIHFDGQDITKVPAHQRKLNTVFQSYALFPHMSVLGNVAYGPLRAGLSRKEAEARAMDALDLVSLTEMAKRYPSEMSGGQRQRVALARAIVNKPKLLLLDEPLSALDMKLRKRMQIELKALQEKLAISFIFVTHDQEEALAMADRIVVMNKGVIEHVGTGDEIYQRPSTRFVADFIGDANLLECRTVDNQLYLSCCNHNLQATPPSQDKPMLAMFRPEDIVLERIAEAPSKEAFSGTVQDVVNIGSYTTYYVMVNTALIEVRRIGANDLHLKKGDVVSVQFQNRRVHFVEA